MDISDADERYLTKREKLLIWMNNPEQLANDKEFEQLWQKYEFIYSLLKCNSKPNAARIVMKKYETGRSMAYQYIKETEEFFGKANAVDLDFLRNLAVEQIQMDIQLARAKGDFKSVSALWRSLSDWSGVNDLKNTIPAHQLEPHTFNLVFQLDGKEDNILSLDNPKQLSEIQKQAILDKIQAEEIPFEEIMEPYENRKAITQ